MKLEIESTAFVGMGLDEALCHEILPRLRADGLCAKFWRLERGGTWLWQCNWFHRDGSVARLATPKPTRSEAFIFACAEYRAGGIEFVIGDLCLSGPGGFASFSVAVAR